MTNQDTTHEVEHDTKLLGLLTEQARAWDRVEQTRGFLLSAATVARVDYRGHAMIGQGGPSSWTGSRDDLEPGTLYHQAKGFSGGAREGYFVVTDDGRSRAATLDDINADHDAVDAVHVERAQAKHDEARKAWHNATDATDEHEESYTGWNRYFLVTSSAGHVHRSMSCSTCNPRTTFAPVVALSGQDDAAAVEMLGSALCTVCFPDAPVDGKVKKITKAQAAKIVKAQ